MLRNMRRRDRLKLGLLKLGEVAQEVGVLPSAIRYYSNLGLLKVTDYTQGRYRLFKRSETLSRLAKIKRLKARGLVLEQILRELGKV